MPYFVPAWAFRTIGTRTMALPRNTVSTACHQFMPPSMRLDASMYVGMQADMLTHRAAIDQTDHVRWAGVVGARSAFDSGDAAVSAGAPARRGVARAVAVIRSVQCGTRIDTNSH